MAINKELFEKVRDKIVAVPESYDQSVYRRTSNKAPCGTAACIAGWAFILSNMPEAPCSCGEPNCIVGIAETARELLGLDESQADIVFNAYGSRWPEPYRTDLLKATTQEAKAHAAANYINYILRTGNVT